MTCDEGRPCQRCVRRNLADTCEDAPRKKKKYLADMHGEGFGQQAIGTVDNLARSDNQDNIYSDNKGIGVELNLNYQHSAVESPMNKKVNFSSDNAPYSGQFENYFPQSEGFDNVASVPSPKIPVESQVPVDAITPFPINGTNFLSSAADLEYSTLSNIVQSNIFQGQKSPTDSKIATRTDDSDSISPVFSNSGEYDRHAPNNPKSHSFENRTTFANSSTSPSTNEFSIPAMDESKRGYTDGAFPRNTLPRPKCDESINQYCLGPTASNGYFTFPDVLASTEALKNTDPAKYQELNRTLIMSLSIGTHAGGGDYQNTRENKDSELTFKEPEEIYEKVKKPFSYTPGYHSLIAYLRRRFSRPMLVKMVESMASYRPSFIACTNSLKEHDLIFMEQCFQRTLLTYDNLIRVTGTPTIVWRRTGEIAYVGNEFCILTGWKTEELLLPEKKFIVELLDDKSVLEYFQLFLKIAFGDFLGATMATCTLLTPRAGVKIKATCTWTLKRDVFGIPMMIIGSFLPVV